MVCFPSPFKPHIYTNPYRLSVCLRHLFNIDWRLQSLAAFAWHKQRKCFRSGLILSDGPTGARKARWAKERHSLSGCGRIVTVHFTLPRLCATIACLRPSSNPGPFIPATFAPITSFSSGRDDIYPPPPHSAPCCRPAGDVSVSVCVCGSEGYRRAKGLMGSDGRITQAC